MKLVWLLWREAYQQAYRRVYLAALADQQAARQIARCCAQVVLDHQERLPAEERSSQGHNDLAQQFLRHVFAAYLRRPGRNDFLRERAHPLSALPGDLNALGTPWPSPAATKPATPGTPPPAAGYIH